MKRTTRWPALLNRPEIAAITAFALVTSITVLAQFILAGGYNQEAVSGIIVEAHGLALEILLFALLFNLLEKHNQKHADEKTARDRINSLRAFKGNQAPAVPMYVRH